MTGYETLEFTDTWLEDFTDRRLSASDRGRILKALRLLDVEERHPSPRVHQLEGDRRGSWSASASDTLRLTFERLADGRKRLLTCTRHYDP
ncbi:MAG: hypothetical protein AB7N24_12045 [Dehalococcoidia bacterium]